MDRHLHMIVVQDSVQTMVDNEDPAAKPLLATNVQEATDKLRLRISEIQDSNGLGGVSAAVADANQLVVTVDKQFGFNDMSIWSDTV